MNGSLARSLLATILLLATWPLVAFPQSIRRTRSTNAVSLREPDFIAEGDVASQYRDELFDDNRESFRDDHWNPPQMDRAEAWTESDELGFGDYGLQVLPRGLMYQSYLAGEKEPRFNAVWLRDKNRKLNWETQLGGRVGLIRQGTNDVIFPEGWQLDLEGAAQTRVLPEGDSDLEAVDFRFGLVWTRRHGPWSMKGGYYHLSSHLGDEFLIKNPGFPRLNYVRDSAIVGVSYDVLVRDRRDVRVYGEVGYAFGYEGGADPLEFQFGSEYSPIIFNGWHGMPFAAVNSHIRQDHDWSHGLNIVAGWQWRGDQTNHRYRVGLQYYDGPSLQWSFSGQNETVFGAGMWFDY